MYNRAIFFFFSSRRRHTRSTRDWSSDVCSSDLPTLEEQGGKEQVGICITLHDRTEHVVGGAAGEVGATGWAGPGRPVGPPPGFRAGHVRPAVRHRKAAGPVPT